MNIYIYIYIYVYMVNVVFITEGFFEIAWDWNRKLAWLGFEHKTTEFLSDALIDSAIRACIPVM